MKKVKIFLNQSISIMLSLIILFAGCKKSDVVSNGNFNKEFSDKSKYSNFIIYPTERELAATYHNDILSEIVPNISLDSTNLNNQVRDLFLNLFDTAQNDISYEDYETLINSNPANIGDYIDNDAVFNLIKDSIETIGNNIYDINDIYDGLADLESYAINNLSGDDEEAALLMIAVSKKSAYYWLPTERGGSGEGYQFLLDYVDYSGNELLGAPNMGGLLTADGVGAAWSFLLIGFLVVPTPVTLGALATVVGWKAAESSVFYLFSAF
jgi:hypothetical protein